MFYGTPLFKKSLCHWDTAKVNIKHMFMSSKCSVADCLECINEYKPLPENHIDSLTLSLIKHFKHKNRLFNVTMVNPYLTLQLYQVVITFILLISIKESVGTFCNE